MNYLITEGERDDLSSVMCQLNMMADMCHASTGLETPCSPDDLGEFLMAQVNRLGEVHRQMTERFVASQGEQQAMRGVDWVNALTIASVGHRGVHKDARQQIDDALSHMAQTDPDYERVLQTWVNVSKVREMEQSWRTEPPEEEPPLITATLFADLIRAVSGQDMEPKALNDAMRQFLAALDEEHPERHVVVQVLNNALLHNGYELVLTHNRDGQHDEWVRKEKPTAPASNHATPGKTATAKTAADLAEETAH